MSRISERVHEIMAMKEMDVAAEEKKTSISLRVDDFTLFCIEELREKIGGSRTAVCLEMVSEGVLEGLEALGLNLDELQAGYVSKRSAKYLEEKK